MINRKSVLALITARGGSKGIPGKNIKPLGGKPLIQWTIDAALHSKFIDRIVISSDSEEILETAKHPQCELLKRPEALAQDHTGSMEVIMHVLNEIEPLPDYFILLQPTSPFRTSADIDRIILQATQTDADIMVSVARQKTHPMFIYEITNGQLRSFSPQREQLRRQDMPPVYVHNGALYFAKTKALLREQSFNTPETQPFITEGTINLDIDTAEDWQYAEYLISEGHQK